ncbi:MAG: Mut7-C RNAse domain-containing protein [Dehalococcoidia bacterium]
MEPKFITDVNVGKLGKWLRLMGYDTLFFDEHDDGLMVKAAIAQGRIVLTKDSEFMKRRAITTGKVKAVLISSDSPEQQLSTIISTLKLTDEYRPFTRCLECNVELVSRDRKEIKGSVPARVYEKHDQYMQCPSCRRIYWKGTHWQAMSRKLSQLALSGKEKKGENL